MAADKQALLAVVLAVKRGLVSPEDGMKILEEAEQDSSPDLERTLYASMPEAEREELRQEAHALAGDTAQATIALNEAGIPTEVQQTLLQIDTASVPKTEEIEATLFSVAPHHADTEIERPQLSTPDDRYRVLREHARGGMGRILVAMDKTVGREVALKELLPGRTGSSIPSSPSSGSTGAEARFLREATVTGQLEHPNIVPVYEIGQREDGQLYYTMKFVRGRTLQTRLRAIRNDPDLTPAQKLDKRLKLLDHFIDICQAIAYAHSRGVIHRDLKPANVMLGDFGETLVLDWGLARVRGVDDGRITVSPEFENQEAGLTLDGEVMGTPAYMPPEQAAGKTDQVDERSDVYALGAMMFEIVTGEAPFTGKSAKQVLSSVLNEEPRRVEIIAPDAPPELAALIRKSMARHPEDRFQNARELADQVRAFRDGRMVSAYKYSAVELARRFVARNRAAVVVTLLALAALLGGGVYAYANVVTQRDAAIAAETDAENQKAIAISEAKEADKARREAEQAQLLAEQTAKEAEQERERADREAETARRAESEAREAAERAKASDNAAQEALREARENLAKTHLALGDAAKLEGRLTEKLVHTAAARVRNPVGVSDTLVLGALGDAVFPAWTSRAYMDMPGGRVSFSADRRLMAGPMHEIPEEFAAWNWSGLDHAFSDIGIWDVASGTLLRRIHTGEKTGRIVRLTADGKTVYAHDENGLLRAWDVATGRSVLTRKTGSNYGVVFEIDGQGAHAYTAAPFGSLRRFSLARDVMLSEIALNEAEVTALDVSGDGSMVVTGTAAGTVTVRNSENMAVLAELTGQGRITRLRFVPEGLLIASVGSEIELWNDSLQTRLRDFACDGQTVTGLARSPYGKYLGADFGPAGWRLFDYQGGEVIGGETAPPSDVLGISFTPDGANLMVIHKGDGLRVIDTSTARHMREENGHRLSCLQADISPDGRLVATGGFDSRVIVRRLTDGTQVWTRQYDSEGIQAVRYSPDGQMLVIGCRNGAVHGLDAADGTVLFSHQIAMTFNISFSHDGGHIACVDLSGRAVVLDRAGVKVREHSFATETPLADARFAPGDDTLWLASMSGAIYTWRWRTDEPPEVRVTATAETQEAIYGIELNHDGELLCAFGWNGDVTVYYTDDLRVAWSDNFSPGGQHNARFSRRGKFIVLGCDDGLIRYVEASTGNLVRKHLAHRSGILGLALSSSGRDIVTTGIDGMVAAWETPSFMYPTSFELHDTQVVDLEISNDGRLVASSCNYGVVRVWTVDGGNVVAEIDLRANWCSGMAFAPDDTVLAIGDTTGRVTLWDVKNDREIRSLRAYDFIAGVAFDAWGRLVVAGTYHGVQVLDADTGDTIAHHRTGQYVDYSFRMFPDGKRYLFSRRSGDHEVRDLESGEVICTVSRGASYYDVVAISPDGETLATHRKDGLISLHRTDTGEAYGYVQARTDESPLGLHFLPRSESLVYFTSGESDLWSAGGSAYIVDIRTGREAASTRMESSFTNKSAIAPDGGFVLMCDSRGGTERWDLDAQKLQRRALVRLSPEDQLEVVQQLSGLKLNGLEVETVPAPAGRVTWLTEDAEPPSYLQSGLPGWVPQLDAMAGTAAEIYLSERSARRRARIELEARKWQIRFEGYRYREVAGADGTPRRIYYAARELDPSGKLVGEAMGRIDYARWLEDEQRKEQRALEQRIQGLVKRGNELEAQGQLVGARSMFNRLRRLQPRKPEWVIRYARLAIRTGDHWTAQSTCEEYLRQGELPRRAEVMLENARTYANEWDVESMRAKFDEARDAGYDRDDWYYFLARAYEDSGAYRQCITFVQSSLARVKDRTVNGRLLAITARCQNWVALRERLTDLPRVVVASVTPGSATAEAGLRLNDVIVSVGEGDFLNHAYDAQFMNPNWEYFLNHAAREVTSAPIVVLRDGEEITLDHPRKALDAEFYTIRAATGD